jgi:hypothetical protein
MVLTATIENVPLIGVPACMLHYGATLLNLVLPRILAEEKIGSKELVMFEHGGRCRDCPQCSHPHDPFGKGIYTRRTKWL